MYYHGAAAATLEGGRLDLRAKKTAAPLIANLLWVPEQQVLGGRFGLSVSIPYASFTRLSAASDTLGRRIATSGWGLGDVSLKAQLGWTGQDGFSHTVSASMWFPTGRYDTGFAPNAGKNHYGVNLAWGFTKIWSDPGIELSAQIGLTGELKNSATKYGNGLGANLDGAIGKVFKNGFTVGIAGFYYRQISNDSGPGALLGTFHGQVAGLGPAVSYNTVIFDRPFSFALRHYWEFEVRNRFKGQITTASITTRF